MNRHLQAALGRAAIITMLAGSPVTGSAQGMGATPPRSPQAWTLEEALGQLSLYPQDAYLQYVALQLARRENRVNEVAEVVERVAFPRARGQGRAGEVDLFSLLTGALAVQESLQLDTMRGEGPRAAFPRPSANPGSDPGGQEEVATQEKQRAALEKRRQVSVPVTSLTGPTIKSHPWEQMLAGRKPELSPLARYVPDDFFFVEFRALNTMLEAMEVSDLWGTHLFNQAFPRSPHAQRRRATQTATGLGDERAAAPLLRFGS